MQYDPEKYVIRTAENRWALFPFTEDVALDLQKPFDTLTMSEVLLKIVDMDVSMVYDPEEWEVKWCHGHDVSPRMLADLKVRNG